MKNVILWMFSLVLVFFACKKDTVESPVDLKKEYFPIKIGHWIDYQVDSIFWGGSQPADTFTFRVRLQIDSAFYDNTGRAVNRMIKYCLEGNSWVEDEVYTVFADEKGVETFQNNKRLLKMVFPVKKHKIWDMNAYNSDDSVGVKYSDIDYPLTMLTTHFDSCATVTIYDIITLVSIDNEEEIYAKNIGMIQRISNHLTTKTNGTIEKGYKVKYTHLSNGIN